MAPTYGGLTVPEARFEIDVARRSSFYLYKVFIPLLLMVFLSWAVFWIEASDLSNQIQVAVTTILTVIAFAFAISATMPRLPYLTYIDAFFLECYIYVFIAVVELMTVHVTHRSELRRDLGLQIRKYSRWLIPASFVVTNAIIADPFPGVISHILKTPKFACAGIGAFIEAAMPSASAARVSTGSSTPSSHRRALE